MIRILIVEDQTIVCQGLKGLLDAQVDLEVIARGTPGFSGADLENLVNEAALMAARSNKDRVVMLDLEMAKDKVMMGPERRSLIITDKDKRITAFHEAGHALVGKMMTNSDPIHKVTIIPRGRALGLTQQLPLEDRMNISRDTANDQITVAMGGRVAEDMVFGQVTTGATNDIQVATDMARKMVCEWGMSDKIGPLNFGRREEMVFLGRDLADQKEYSEQTAVEIDAEVRRIVTENHERARAIVKEHMDKLKVLAEALLEYETLEGREIDLLFEGKPIGRPAPIARRTDMPKSAPKERASLFPGPSLPDPEKA